MIRRMILCVALVSIAGLHVTVSPAVADDAYLVAHMSGAAPRPGPGDPDAFGRAVISIRDETNQICLRMWWRNVDGTLSGPHIHVAPPASAGPIVIPFTTPPAGPSHTYQCRTVSDEALLDNVAANPHQYYIDLHTRPLYPGGAIRGQLEFL